MLSRYWLTHQRDVAPPTWVIDIFLELSIPYENILTVLERLFFNEEPPFQGRNRRNIANCIIYVVHCWFEDSSRGGRLVFGGAENAAAVAETLRSVVSAGVLDEATTEQARLLRLRVEHVLR